jgi:hypothetical protein
MHSTHRLFWIAPLLGAFLVFSIPASAAPGGAAHALCGGNKKKDAKKPKQDDGKKPANPAAAEGLCGGNGKKDVKKPKQDDGKKPANPA